MNRVEVLRYGEIPYGVALDLQSSLRQNCYDDPEFPGYVVALQHSPVVTLGKRGRAEDIISPDSLAEFGAEIFEVDRGGEATYHGPGQLVIYPIVRLEKFGLGVVDLVRGLADVLAATVAEFAGVEIVYDTDHPGLWTTEDPARKMASVGMRVSRGVSTHGAALNLTTHLIPFSYIVACGMPNAPMTRLQDYVDEPIDLGRFTDLFLERIATSLDAEFYDSDHAATTLEQIVSQ